MNLVNAILAESKQLPPIAALGYEYVIAANGLFIRTEDSRLSALVPLADDLTLHGLVALEPFVQLKLPRVPERFLRAILGSARRHLPNEAMYMFTHTNQGWGCRMPGGSATPTSLTFNDNSTSVIDLHSHATMGAFFSSTDDADERGFRVYCVVGKVDTDAPEILSRVGVYGHHILIPAETIFESLGAFTDKYAELMRDPRTDAMEYGIAETESGLLVARY